MTMTELGHLWAVGYDDLERAEQLRSAMTGLAESRCLVLLDTAVAVRYADGSITLDGETFVPAARGRARTITGFLAGLMLGAPPLTGADVGSLLRGTGRTTSDPSIVDFVSEIARLMKPGTSVLFVLDREGDMEAILQGIRGLGGTVLKTNVDLERTRLIQSTLAAGEDPRITADSPDTESAEHPVSPGKPEA
jgi:uncharacterized membrane protein